MPLALTPGGGEGQSDASTSQTAGGTEQETIQYVWSQRYIDTPICRLRDADGDGTFEETLYYVTDAGHNVTAMVSAATGQVVERYAYDPYGRVIVLNGSADADGADYSPDPDNASDVANVLLYAGYRFDAAAGVYHVRNRYHHPTLGRWINRDPKGYVDGMNLYQYVASRPTAATDPMGTEYVTVDCSWKNGANETFYLVHKVAKGTTWYGATEYSTDRSYITGGQFLRIDGRSYFKYGGKFYDHTKVHDWVKSKNRTMSQDEFETAIDDFEVDAPEESTAEKAQRILDNALSGDHNPADCEWLSSPFRNGPFRSFLMQLRCGVVSGKISAGRRIFVARGRRRPSQANERPKFRQKHAAQAL